MGERSRGIQMLNIKDVEALGKEPEEVQLLGDREDAQALEQRLKAQYTDRERFPYEKPPCHKKLLKVALVTLTGMLVVLLPVLGVLHKEQEQHDHDRAAAAYEHMKARVPEGFPIHLPEGAGEPIKKAPKPPEAKVPMLPILQPYIDYSSLLKPGFHLTPEYGWMNDPNGMFQAPNGFTHVFFQLNPVAPVWGSPWWGHVLSEDMAHWRRLPPALKPDQWYDKDGVFSGSATLLPNGSVVLLYTGVIDSAQYGFLYQLQAAAVPANTSDPYLTEWKKLPSNPTSIEIPPGGTHAQFRDPITAWTLSATELEQALDHWGLDVPCTTHDGPAGQGSSRGLRSSNSTSNSNNTSGDSTTSNSSSGGSSGSNSINSNNGSSGSNSSSTSSAGVSKTNVTSSHGAETVDKTSGGRGDSSGVGGNSSNSSSSCSSNNGSSSSNSSTSSSSSTVEKAHQGEEEDGEDCSNKLVYMTAVGTMNNCLGGASLYVSLDEIRSWKYVGSLFSQLGQNYTYYETCLPPPEQRDRGDNIPPGSKGYGGHCDQFGKDCRMWECPDFFETNTPGIQAFKYSDQARERFQFAQDFYVLSESHLTNYSLAGLQDGQDAFSGMMDGDFYPATPVDYGVVYASKSFQAADKRRLWLGWVFEDSLGCTELCADGTPFIREVLQWQGAQTLMREITYNADTQTLRFYPIAETRKLRVGAPLYDNHFLLHTHGEAASPVTELLLPEERTYDGATVQQSPQSGGAGKHAGGDPTGGAPSPVLGPSHPSSLDTSPSRRRQVEVLLNFTLQAEEDELSIEDTDKMHPFEFALELLTGNGTYTRIKVNGTASVPGGPSNRECGTIRPAPHLLGGERWSCVHTAVVWVDREHSGGFSKDSTQGGPIKLPAAGVKATDLSLDVWVDRSLLEVYAFDGSSVVTSRIYPLPHVEKWPGSDQTPRHSAEAGITGHVQMGAWGYQVSATWAPGHVKVKAEAHELGSCWIEEKED